MIQQITDISLPAAIACILFGGIVGVLMGYWWTNKGNFDRFKNALIASGKMASEEIESIIDVVRGKSKDKTE